MKIQTTTTSRNLCPLTDESALPSLADLSPDLVEHIAMALPPRDIDQLQLTSKHLHAVLAPVDGGFINRYVAEHATSCRLRLPTTDAKRGHREALQVIQEAVLLPPDLVLKETVWESDGFSRITRSDVANRLCMYAGSIGPRPTTNLIFASREGLGNQPPWPPELAIVINCDDKIGRCFNVRDDGFSELLGQKKGSLFFGLELDDRIVVAGTSRHGRVRMCTFEPWSKKYATLLDVDLSTGASRVLFWDDRVHGVIDFENGAFNLHKVVTSES